MCCGFRVSAYYEDDRAIIYHGDCIEVLRSLPDNSVDSVVTDPPYLLDFMGKGWDAADGIAGKPEVWREALRVLKPGGHLLAFGGTRTWHRLAVAIEDAGFEVRDSIAWMYGSGFPKSLDVSKAIDKAAGAQREVLGETRQGAQQQSTGRFGAWGEGITPTAPATPAAQQWQGWGTALKPAFEPIVVARKPLIGTVAANVLKYNSGALNIDGCRIGTQEMKRTTSNGEVLSDNGSMAGADYVRIDAGTATGRWPANVILDESQAAALDAQSGVTTTKQPAGVVTDTRDTSQSIGAFSGAYERQALSDTGGASRFFYCAKAGKKERPNVDGVAHPTVKPIKLMEYLCRLVTPPGGTILEPFAGSGTTIEAALNEGFNVIGIEMTDEYLPLIMARIERHGEKLC